MYFFLHLTSIVLDCKTVRISSAFSSTREQSNKRSGTRLKTGSDTGERLLTFLRHDFFTDFEKKTTVLQPPIVPLTISCCIKKKRGENGGGGGGGSESPLNPPRGTPFDCIPYMGDGNV